MRGLHADADVDGDGSGTRGGVRVTGRVYTEIREVEEEIVELIAHARAGKRGGEVCSGVRRRMRRFEIPVSRRERVLRRLGLVVDRRRDDREERDGGRGEPGVGGFVF